MDLEKKKTIPKSDERKIKILSSMGKKDIGKLCSRQKKLG